VVEHLPTGSSPKEVEEKGRKKRKRRKECEEAGYGFR
jgi:hypothetical protein